MRLTECAPEERRRSAFVPEHVRGDLSQNGIRLPEAIPHQLEPGRHAGLEVLQGAARPNGLGLAAGDGVAVSDEKSLTLLAPKPAEIMLFDLS
jgi:hypothetical protein